MYRIFPSLKRQESARRTNQARATSDISRHHQEKSLPPNAITRYTLVLAMKIRRRDSKAHGFDSCFHYCGVVGRLLFLQKIAHPDIVYTTHQCVQLSDDPRATHGAAVENFVKYLAATKNNRILLDPKKDPKLVSLCGFHFQQKLEYVNISQRHQNRKIGYRLRDYLNGLIGHMGFQDTNSDNADFYHRQLHVTGTVIMLLYPSYVNYTVN